MVKYLYVDLFLVNSFFDITEFDRSPIKSYVKNEFRPVNSLFKTGVLYSLKKSNISVQNSPFGFGEYHSYEFHSFEKKDNYLIEYD